MSKLLSQAHKDLINTALAPYGASLIASDYIQRPSRETQVKATVHGRRIRFKLPSGTLLASGPVDPEFVSSFVERFWSWQPVKETI